MYYQTSYSQNNNYLQQKSNTYLTHLGNVLTVITDRKLQTCGSEQVLHYEAQVISVSDYYPFGMQMTGREWQSEEYRFGFNGKESDNEMSGNGNVYDYGFRVYNPRIGKFLSVDPLFQSYPWYTPYQFAGNQVIWAIDLDGLEEFIVTHYFSNDKLTLVALELTSTKRLKKQRITYKINRNGVESIAYKSNQFANKKQKEIAEKMWKSFLEMDKNNNKYVKRRQWTPIKTPPIKTPDIPEGEGILGDSPADLNPPSGDDHVEPELAPNRTDYKETTLDLNKKSGGIAFFSAKDPSFIDALAEFSKTNKLTITMAGHGNRSFDGGPILGVVPESKWTDKSCCGLTRGERIDLMGAFFKEEIVKNGGVEKNITLKKDLFAKFYNTTNTDKK